VSPAFVLALLLAAAPEFRVSGEVSPEVVRIAERAWADVESTARGDGLRAPEEARPVRIGSSDALPPGVAAASRPGSISLRPRLPLTGTGAGAIRHEVAHQFLFEACPSAQGDRLFHEAFAVSVSGELVDWSRSEDGRYLPLGKALEDLGRSSELDAPIVRRALARLLADVPARPDRLPPALARRVTQCEAGARWTPMRPEELATDDAPAADATVVISRHSGEVLASEGAASLPMPFGSTLKPFLVAGAPGPSPRIRPDASRPGWRCGDALPDRMDAATALLRSCNGWFLDWARAEPRVVRFGPWGPILEALGLSALPADASEAIGVRPSLRMTPLGIAQAYRVLAEARPDLVDILSRNSREGTLSGLDASAALSGVAAKTGTVLDASANPRLGWIVAVDRDVVVVMARAGRTPRVFAGALVEALGRARSPAVEAAKVQVFGLVGPGDVRARCEGRGVVLADGRPRLVPEVETSLGDLAREGAALCAGGPWKVRVPGTERPRAYTGLFTHDPAPPVRGGPPATPREQRARRGSDLVFRTTRLSYAAGVVAAEDAASKGEARVALARVADSNGGHPRHRGRPVCDTTHCQAFLGTAPAGKEERRALAAPLRTDGWLAFSRGGTEPWRETRGAAEVRAALAPDARTLAFGGGRVSFVTSATDGLDRWEERRELPCESLRGPLKLPSCPDRVTASGTTMVFEGHGQGHGEGLDVEWASRSGLSAERILEAAYGSGAIWPGTLGRPLR
jgi:hypothetical protein